jgi:hypothetical protein
MHACVCRSGDIQHLHYLVSACLHHAYVHVVGLQSIHMLMQDHLKVKVQAQGEVNSDEVCSVSSSFMSLSIDGPVCLS